MNATSLTVWQYCMEGTLKVGKFGEFTAKTYLAEENLVNFVHSQTKSYENFV